MMKAIKIVDGHRAEICEVHVPKVRDGYMLCKVNCVALNPTDWKHIDKVGKPGSTVGCDMCGIVEEVGSGVNKSWSKGDRIAAFVHGSNDSQPEDGVFAEHCTVKADLALRVPDSLSDEEAATLVAGAITCGQGLYQSLGIPLPEEGNYDEYVLVYGASTATGSLAVQYAVLSGCKVIATASERNWKFLKSLGAEEVFDYKDPNCASKIKEYTKDSLRLVLDCIAESGSSEICEGAISSKGGKIAYLLRAQPSRSDVEGESIFAYTAMGEPFHKLGRRFEAKPEDFDYAKKFVKITEDLLRAGKLRPHPSKVGIGGLEGVLDGLQQLRDGKVSGVKLVYPLSEI